MISAETQYLANWLALSYVSGIGPSRFLKLLNFFPDLKDVFKASHQQLSTLGLTADIIAGIQKPDWAAVEKDLKWAE